MFGQYSWCFPEYEQCYQVWHLADWSYAFC